MKKKKYEELQLDIPVFKSRVILYIGATKDLPKKVRENIQGDDNYIARANFALMDDSLCHNVVIHSKSAAISVIAHEAVHAASMIFDSMGCVADFENDEYTAYLVQYICESVENHLDIYGVNNE